MTGRGGKLQQLHCYHTFSDSLNIYLTKNHYENYSPKMVPIAKIWGPGSWTKCCLIINWPPEQEPLSKEIHVIFSVILLNVVPAVDSDFPSLSAFTLFNYSMCSSHQKALEGVQSVLPNNMSCEHRAMATDYMPYVRHICQAEQLRRVNNTKRR